MTVIAELVACSSLSRTAGTRVQVAIVVSSDAAGVVDGGQVAEPGSNPRYAITVGHIAVKDVQLVPCSARDDASVAAALLPWLRSVAFAHGGRTPFGIPSPVVVDLAGRELAPQVLGEIQPPAGSYCSLRVTTGSVDGHAQGAPDDWGEMGPAFRVLGLAAGTDGGADRDFVLSSDDGQTVELALPDGPVGLYGVGDSRMLTIHADVRPMLARIEPGASMAWQAHMAQRSLLDGMSVHQGGVP